MAVVGSCRAGFTRHRASCPVATHHIQRRGTEERDKAMRHCGAQREAGGVLQMCAATHSAPALPPCMPMAWTGKARETLTETEKWTKMKRAALDMPSIQCERKSADGGKCGAEEKRG